MPFTRARSTAHSRRIAVTMFAAVALTVTSLATATASAAAPAAATSGGSSASSVLELDTSSANTADAAALLCNALVTVNVAAKGGADGIAQSGKGPAVVTKQHLVDCQAHNAGTPSTTMTLAIPSGTATITISSAANGGTAFSALFGGDCTNQGPGVGRATVEPSSSNMCSVQLVPLQRSAKNDGNGNGTSTLVSVTERVVSTGATGTTGATGATGSAEGLLCATTANVAVTNGKQRPSVAAGLAMCHMQQNGDAPGGPAAHTADDTAEDTQSAVITIARGATNPAVVVSDDFSHTGYVTSYSDGCEVWTGGASAKLTHRNGDPATCTITHTYTDNSTSTSKTGVLELDGSVAATGPSDGSGDGANTSNVRLCDAQVTVTAQQNKDQVNKGDAASTGVDKKPFTSCQPAHGGAPSNTLTLAVPPGDATITITASKNGEQAFSAVFGGDCTTSAVSTGRVRVIGHAKQVCSVTLYPLAKSSAKGTDKRLAVITEQVVTSGAGKSVAPASSLVCTTSVRFADLPGKAGNQSKSQATFGDASRMCPSDSASGDGRQATSTATSTASATVSMLVAHKDGTRLGVVDDFTQPDFVTTFSNGCSAAGVALAKSDVVGTLENQTPLTCTITHTYTATKAAKGDALLQLAASVAPVGTTDGGRGSDGPGVSLCDATLSVVAQPSQPGPNAAGSGKTRTAPLANCSATGLHDGPPTSASLAMAVPASRLTLTVTAKTTGNQLANKQSFRAVFGGDCGRNPVESTPGRQLTCSVVLYPISGSTKLGNGKTSRLLIITETVTAPASNKQVQLASLLCRTRMQVGLSGAGTPKANAPQPCAVNGGNGALQPGSTSTTAGSNTVTSTVSDLVTNLSDGKKTLLVSDDFAQSGFVTTFGSGCRSYPAASGHPTAAFDAGVPGTCTITHTLAGNKKTVAAASSSTTTLSCPPSAEVDSTMSCTVSVSAPGSTPSGSVTVSPSSSSCALFSGQCTVSVPTGTTVGNLTVSANYPRQGSVAASSVSTSVPITLRATSVTASCAGANASAGTATPQSPVTCTLHVADTQQPASYTPDGTVSATTGSAIQSCVLSSGSCTVTLSGGLPSGTSVIAVTYGGDSTEYAASTTTTSVQTAAIGATTSVTGGCGGDVLSDPTNSGTTNSHITCAFTLTTPADAPVPTQPITVMPGNLSCGDVSSGFIGPGTYLCIVSVPTSATPGTMTVTASYPGETGLAASTGSATVTLTSPAPTTTTKRPTDMDMTCSSGGYDDGYADPNAAIVCTLSVHDTDAPGQYVPTGTATVTLADDPQTCQLGALAPGSCMVTYAAGLPAGGYTYSASYSGDGSEQSSTVPSRAFNVGG